MVNRSNANGKTEAAEKVGRPKCARKREDKRLNEREKFDMIATRNNAAGNNTARNNTARNNTARNNVTVIPATVNFRNNNVPQRNMKRKTAGYARVSTDSDEQENSYEAQVDYYTRFINENPNYEFAGIYTDEAVSGLMLKNRDGFNRMIADALAGKIELIITKSVSRFARNTVDALQVRP